MKSPGFNQTSAERVEENITKEPTKYLERPIVDKRLKRAQDALEEQRLQRELHNEFDIGEDDE